MIEKTLEHPATRVAVFLLAVMGVGFQVDPVFDFLIGDPSPIVLIGIPTALIVGYLGYSMLDVGSASVVGEATAIVNNKGWSQALIPGILALGTSFSEMGFVIVATISGRNEVLAHAIIGSDGFQLGVLFFGCVICAKTQQWDPRLLRRDVTLLTIMAFFVLSATINGFDRVHGFLITTFALLSAWQFLADAPEGIFDEEDGEEDDKAMGSVFNLVTGFALLLLGTVWFFDSITYIAGILGIPEFVIGIIGAVVTSAGEVFTSVPLVKSGKKGLFFAAIALAGSNAFDTSFLGISALIRPFSIEPVFHNIAPAVVTLALTALLLYFVFQKEIPKWVGYVVVPTYIASFILLAIV